MRGGDMSTSKTIYRDLVTNRLITQQMTTSRDPESWVEEVFTPIASESDDQKQKDMPSVKYLDS